jgi:lysozyme
LSTRGRKALAAGGAMSLVAFTALFLTMPWEAKRNVAYWDAIGHVWTVCYGETLNVKPGDHYTDQQCLDMLLKRLDRDFDKPLKACLVGYDAIPFGVKASFLDLAWNVGVPTVCSSTAAKRAAVKDWAGACQAMTWFNRAGGRVIKGLDLRRKNGDPARIGENEICLAGVTP